MVTFSNVFKIQYLPSLFTDEAELLRVGLQIGYLDVEKKDI